MNTTCSWSGGKDSALALLFAQQAGYFPQSIIHIANDLKEEPRAHDVPLFVLEQQAQALGIPLFSIPASWKDYASVFLQTLYKTKEQHDVQYIVFGDIDLQYHLDWEKQLAEQAKLNPIWPLQHLDRLTVARNIVDIGIQATIVSVQSHLSTNWLGKSFTHQTIDALLDAGIDPCGEDGSFHTIVHHAPNFHKKVDFSMGKIYSQSNHHYIEILPPLNVI